VSRRQDYEKIKENFAFLATTQVHLHADLIAGLPGETLESFARGFDAVSKLGPAEIQVGILKRLKGTPIIRHDDAWGMVYQDAPPFQVLQTKEMPFESLQTVSRFAHFWDLIANSGNFTRTLSLLKDLSDQRPEASLYAEFSEIVEFLSQRHATLSQGHGVALLNLLESVWIYLIETKKQPREKVREMLILDYSSQVKRDVPRFLKDDTVKSVTSGVPRPLTSHTPARQKLHLRADARLGMLSETR
jgi:Protein of unknown function (DUF4080)